MKPNATALSLAEGLGAWLQKADWIPPHPQTKKVCCLWEESAGRGGRASVSSHGGDRWSVNQAEAFHSGEDTVSPAAGKTTGMWDEYLLLLHSGRRF